VALYYPFWITRYIVHLVMAFLKEDFEELFWYPINMFEIPFIIVLLMSSFFMTNHSLDCEFSWYYIR
jgi:hypothetical protein